MDVPCLENPDMDWLDLVEEWQVRRDDHQCVVYQDQAKPCVGEVDRSLNYN